MFESLDMKCERPEGTRSLTGDVLRLVSLLLVRYVCYYDWCAFFSVPHPIEDKEPVDEANGSHRGAIASQIDEKCQYDCV